MTRLTTSLKKQIIENAIERSPLTKKRKNIMESITDLIDEIRLDSIGGLETEKKLLAIEKRTIKQIDKLGQSSLVYDAGLLCKRNNVYINNAGMRNIYSFGGYLLAHYEITLKATSKLGQKLTKLNNDRSDIVDAVSDLKIEIRATLDQFNTVKKLIEGWPEVKAILPADNKPAECKDLVVNTDALNKLCDLK